MARDHGIEPARKLLEEAVSLTRSLAGSPWQRADALTGVARQYASLAGPETALGLWAEAVGLAREDESSTSPQDSGDAAKVLIDIAEALARLGHHGRAREIAGATRNPGWRARALEVTRKAAETVDPRPMQKR